jgi:hypothetical protein
MPVTQFRLAAIRREFVPLGVSPLSQLREIARTRA